MGKSRRTRIKTSLGKPASSPHEAARKQSGLKVAADFSLVDQ